MNNKKKSYYTEQSSNKRGMTPVIIFLSIAVVLSLALLGYYVWQNRPDNAGEISPSPTPTITASITEAPTATPTEGQAPTPAPTDTPVPTEAGSPEPSTAPEPTSAPYAGPNVTPVPKLPFKPVKALYLKPGSYQDEKRLQHYIDLANRTEINAYVIDIKGDYGDIYYKSEIPDVVAAKACSDFDIHKVIEKFHQNNIRVIGRIVTFKDNVITNYKPSLAIKHNGETFVAQDGSKAQWLDPTNRGSWEYIGNIVREAVNFGFDEIQFDYIRFPETSLFTYELQNLEEGKERRDYIEGFIEYIRSIVPPDTILSADIFGWPLIATRDSGEIGQTVESIGWNLDYISPMVYPSHFDKKSQVINGINFTKPDLQPYEVVYNTLLVGKKRIESVEGYNLKCRPYIQGFTASYLGNGYYTEYGVKEYRAQIQAVYDAGYEEWIFWNARNEYVEEAFLPEGQ